MRTTWAALVAILLLTGAGGVAFWLWREPPVKYPPAEYPVKRVLRYSFTVGNPTNQLIERAWFWTYAPVKQMANQRTAKIEASHPYELMTDELGNQRLHFTFENFPPYSSKIISLTTELDLAEEPNRVRMDQLDRYLQAETYVESAHPRLAKAAAKLTAETPAKSARNIYQWVVRNIQGQGYIKNDRGALYALDNQHGDCTEYAYLVTALSRANGIPARSVAGYVYDKNAVLDSSDYHNWAEVYIDGTWQIADAQKEAFMDKNSQYIAMRLIVVDKDDSFKNSQRFFATSENLDVKMN